MTQYQAGIRIPESEERIAKRVLDARFDYERTHPGQANRIVRVTNQTWWNAAVDAKKAAKRKRQAERRAR